MTNSADPDQLASLSQLIWIYSVCKAEYIRVQQNKGLGASKQCMFSCRIKKYVHILFEKKKKNTKKKKKNPTHIYH